MTSCASIAPAVEAIGSPPLDNQAADRKAPSAHNATIAQMEKATCVWMSLITPGAGKIPTTRGIDSVPGTDRQPLTDPSVNTSNRWIRLHGSTSPYELI